MNWFKNLKTMTKLMAAFGIMALLLAVIGYQALNTMGKVDEITSSLYKRSFLGTVAIQDVAMRIALIGRHTRGVLVYTDREAMQHEKDKVDALFSQLDEAMTRVDQSFVTEKGKAVVAQIHQLIPEYRTICANTARLSMANDKKGALDVITKGSPVLDRVSALVKEGISLKVDFAKKSYEDSVRLNADARTFMIGMIVFAIGLALGLGYFIANLIARPLRQAVVVLESFAAGDLTNSLEVHSRDEVGQMAIALNAALAGMREALVEVRGSADMLASSSKQLAASSEDLSGGAQGQAASLEETSASLQQITSPVRQNADSAKQANQLAAAARDTAEKGGQVVTSAVSAMAEINSSSKKIADIISAIDEIAFQTNLLALNAAVEAARAGEQGRGFAVVAAEVRSLAQRSATAAKEIKTLIQDSVRKVDAGSQMVNKSGEVLLEIVSSVKRVTDIVGEIAAASREQASGVDQISKAMTQMDQVTQQNSAQTEELSGTAISLSSGAAQLQSLVARFRLETERTGRPMRPAAQPQRKPAPRKSAARSGEFSHNVQALSRKVSSPAPMPAEVDPFAEPVAERTSGFGDF